MPNKAKAPETQTPQVDGAAGDPVAQPSPPDAAAPAPSGLLARVPARLRRYGTIALIAVVALGVVLLMNTVAAGMQAGQQEDFRATAMSMAQGTIDAATGGPASALMPSYGSEADFEGISRLVSIDTIIPSRARVNIMQHTVERGDTLFGLADLYGVKPESILWFNFELLNDNPNEIKPGQVLNIPPVDGMLVTYRTGESLYAIAENASYSTNVTINDIIEWPGNDLDPYETDPDNPNIPDGFQLIIPNGSRLLRDWGPPVITRQNAATAAYYGPGACGAIYEGAVGNGTFRWPSVATYLSGYDYTPPLHNGIDIAGAEGNAIYATDGGVVVYAGWSNTGYGNLVVIDHGTGWQSAYAHLLSYSVGCGQSVSQGTVIGGLGSTGNSSGPHLHFELYSGLYGKVNPWDFLFIP
ncbi:MAG: M23 family metallopeptidase [Anaerolineales bacterium]|nr:M23 family metallopeptidase [Anaerolineales bacterium]